MQTAIGFIGFGASELAGSCDLLFSTVTSSSALDAARQHAPFLGPPHMYADLNSVSPALKREVAGVVDRTGAAFVEVAVMAPVRPYRHRVPMLAGGAAAAAFLRAIRVEPIMAEATARRQDWCAHQNLRARFGPDGPATYREVLDALDAV
jgi:3-hydroxyisobutyrate dehydrogenase-like beta-hydroxyacid dehydrogenase